MVGGDMPAHNNPQQFARRAKAPYQITDFHLIHLKDDFFRLEVWTLGILWSSQPDSLYLAGTRSGSFHIGCDYQAVEVVLVAVVSHALETSSAHADSLGLVTLALLPFEDMIFLNF